MSNKKSEYVHNYGHIYLSYTNFHRCIACRIIMEMDKFEVNDDLNIYNMNTLNNKTQHGENDTQFCNLSFI